jgi:hypothetical protein
MRLTKFLSDESNVFLRKILKHNHFLRLRASWLITSAALALVWHVFCRGLGRFDRGVWSWASKESLNGMKAGPL